MDDLAAPASGLSGLVRTGFADASDPAAVDGLAAALGHDPLELIILFASPLADPHHLIAQAQAAFGKTPVIGCTTAGELSDTGYAEGQIVALGLPRRHFRAQITLIDDVQAPNGRDLMQKITHDRAALITDAPDWSHEFAFLVVDGLSTKEDELAVQLAASLGQVPLFGGSAGDGESFGATFVFSDGRAMQNAAVLAQIRTDCPIRVFRTDHLVPTDDRMVVTAADPARRIVSEINGEPAAAEYARVLGHNPEDLSPFTFAAHPVVVRLGDRHHVRSIQRVLETGEMVFFSAVDEGMVLRLAEATDMVTHLKQALGDLAATDQPELILGCDCLLRRLEAQQKQCIGALSDLLVRHRVVGFSTYGEQNNALHVNQTLTGVAIYPPRTAP